MNNEDPKKIFSDFQFYYKEESDYQHHIPDRTQTSLTSQVKIDSWTRWQITAAHGLLQSLKSVMLSAKPDELMRFSAPTPQLASMKALKEEPLLQLLLFYHMPNRNTQR